MTTSAYDALVRAFPASVTVTLDRPTATIAFRIAGTPISIKAEVERIEAICAGRAWIRLLGPARWDAGLFEPEWVLHAEARLLQ